MHIYSADPKLKVPYTSRGPGPYFIFCHFHLFSDAVLWVCHLQKRLVDSKHPTRQLTLPKHYLWSWTQNSYMLIYERKCILLHFEQC